MHNDSYQKIVCPACGKPMAKVMLNSTTFYVDMCVDGCGGIFLNNGELNFLMNDLDALKEILANINLSNSLNLLDDKSFEPVMESSVRVCPVCKLPMSKDKFNDADVIIDTCDKCGSKFLDFSEFEKLLKAN